MNVNTEPDRPVLLERKLPAPPNPAVRLARVHGLTGELEEKREHVTDERTHVCDDRRKLPTLPW